MVRGKAEFLANCKLSLMLADGCQIYSNNSLENKYYLLLAEGKVYSLKNVQLHLMYKNMTCAI